MPTFQPEITDPSERLRYMHDVEEEGKLLLQKWSKHPTLDRKTGKVTFVDWLNTDKVGRWDVPELKTEQDKLHMAILLENKSRYRDGDSIVQASFPTQFGDLSLPALYALPIIRRVYAQLLAFDFCQTVPMNGPLAYLFFLDFIRGDSTNNTNILSVEYNYPLTAENGVPKSGKLKLVRTQITAVKELLGVTWSQESEEDMQASLGQNIEELLVGAFSDELGRNLLARALAAINTAAVTGTSQGSSLVAPWIGPNTQHQFNNIGTLTVTDYKQSVYSSLINADVDYQRANRQPSNSILCGYGLAGFLQKINTATQSTAPGDMNDSNLGITDYGTFAGRWKIQGTDLLPDTQGFLYRRNEDYLHSGAIYSPYIPIQVMPKVYGEYDTTTGAWKNTDKWTRNIRERSAFTVTKAYRFQPILAPSNGLAQY